MNSIRTPGAKQSIGGSSPSNEIKPSKAPDVKPAVGAGDEGASTGWAPKQKFDAKKVAANARSQFGLNPFSSESSAKFQTNATVGLAAAAQGVLTMGEQVWRAPELAERAMDYVNSVLPQGMKTWNPFSPIAHGVDIGGTHFGGTSELADNIARSREMLSQEFAPFRAVAEKTQALDRSVSTALETGDTRALAESVNDPATWLAVAGSAAPSLVTGVMSGGSIPFATFMSALQGTSNAAAFEKQTGIKVKPDEFLQAQAQMAAFNGTLQRFGVQKLLDKVPGAKTSVADLIATMANAAIAGGATAVNNNVAEKLSYNKDKKLTDGVGTGVMGGIAGAGIARVAQYAAKNGSIGLSTTIIDGNDTFTTASKKLGLTENAYDLEQGVRNTTMKKIDQVLAADPELISQLNKWYSDPDTLPPTIRGKGGISQIEDAIADAHNARGRPISLSDLNEQLNLAPQATPAQAGAQAVAALKQQHAASIPKDAMNAYERAVADQLKSIDPKQAPAELANMKGRMESLLGADHFTRRTDPAIVDVVVKSGRSPAEVKQLLSDPELIKTIEQNGVAGWNEALKAGGSPAELKARFANRQAMKDNGADEAAAWESFHNTKPGAFAQDMLAQFRQNNPRFNSVLESRSNLLLNDENWIHAMSNPEILTNMNALAAKYPSGVATAVGQLKNLPDMLGNLKLIDRLTKMGVDDSTLGIQGFSAKNLHKIAANQLLLQSPDVAALKANIAKLYPAGLPEGFPVLLFHNKPGFAEVVEASLAN
jgi:hypothetical protein